MKLALHGLSTALLPLAGDIRVARETGHDGLEVVGPKLTRFLEAGHSYADLHRILNGFQVAGLGYIQDVEREKPEDYKALVEETELVCTRAEKIGAEMVQLLTGPLLPNGPYRGLEGRPWPEIRRITAKNLGMIGDIGRAHGISFYLEPLAFATLHRLDHALEVVDAAERENVGLVIDFWHLWDGGATPDQIAKVDKKVIRFAHFCDSLDAFGSRGSYEQVGRAVWTGAGHIPLKLWVDAVRATGYDGWWSCELLSPHHWELDPVETVCALKQHLKMTLA